MSTKIKLATLEQLEGVNRELYAKAEADKLAISSDLTKKLDLSALTFEQEGKTYLAKFTIENGIPKIIADEVV